MSARTARRTSPLPLLRLLWRAVVWLVEPLTWLPWLVRIGWLWTGFWCRTLWRARRCPHELPLAWALATGRLVVEEEA